MRTIILVGLVAAAVLSLPGRGYAAKSIIGSAHDFTDQTWNTKKTACGVCHAVHGANADKSIQLWSHKSTTASFQAYQSPTMNARVGEPMGTSRACLSCHDGTIGVNEVGSDVVGGASVRIGQLNLRSLIGTDLRDDHPVSFVYNSSLASSDGTLVDPDTTPINSPGFAPGSTVSQALLRNGYLECVSCHDVHRQRGVSDMGNSLLVISGPGSKLCLTCHKK